MYSKYKSNVEFSNGNEIEEEDRTEKVYAQLNRNFLEHQILLRLRKAFLMK